MRLLFLVGVLASLATGVSGQEPRDGLTIELDHLFPAVLGMIDRQDWDQLEKVVTVLEPLAVHVDSISAGRPGASFHAAVSSRDQPRALLAFLELATGGIADLVERAPRASESTARRELVRVGFAELIAISPALKSQSFSGYRELEGAFRRAYAVAEGDPADFAGACTYAAHLLRSSRGPR